MVAPLSPDIIDCVFTSLPDFATLLSTILVSKSFHGVFQAHPNSILTSVARTHIGFELLPCALRLLHFNRDEYLASREDYVGDFPLERKFSHNEVPVVAPYVAALAKNDRVVTELELFFSTTHKDGKTGTQSFLSPRESLRFRRALYRQWLLNELFPGCYLRKAGERPDDRDEDDTDDSDDDDDNDGDTDAPSMYLEKSQGLRRKFFREFSDDEVAEMWQVHNFMALVSSWTQNAVAGHPWMQTHTMPWDSPSTPAELLRSLRSFDEPKNLPVEQPNWDHTYPDNNWPGLIGYLLEKNYDTSWMDTNWVPGLGKNVILDNGIEDAEECCDECHTPYLSTQLWSSSNWHLLPCVVSRNEAIRTLPGHLDWNGVEIGSILSTPWMYTSFVDLYVSPGVPDWSEGKTMCKQCILRLMGRRTLNSLRELKAQHGPQLEDCWYGYKCRTQRRHDHAVKLNHLCDPTRGD